MSSRTLEELSLQPWNSGPSGTVQNEKIAAYTMNAEQLRGVTIPEVLGAGFAFRLVMGVDDSVPQPSNTATLGWLRCIVADVEFTNEACPGDPQPTVSPTPAPTPMPTEAPGASKQTLSIGGSVV